MTSSDGELSELHDFFRRNDAQLELVSYTREHEARLQLLDVDGYKIGTLVCEDVEALCISTRGQEFEALSVYRRQDLPPTLSYMRERFTDDLILLVLKPIDDEDYPAFLPLIDSHRLAYIICGAAHLIPGRS
jgi:hypothetical protein